MKTVLRIVVLVVTSPIWLLGGVMVAVIAAIFSFPEFMDTCLNFGFTGKWEWQERKF